MTWLAALTLLTALVYVPTLRYGFVFDDHNWVAWVPDPQVAAPAWRYVSRAPWAVAAWLGGGLPWAYHAVVVSLHLLNGGLLYRLARRWLSVPAALLTLTLFWLHPMQVESVAYISGGMEVLLTTYVLLALLAGPNLLGLLALALAVQLKPSAVPLLLAVPFVWTRRKYVWGAAVAAVLLIVALTPTYLAWLLRAAPLADRLQQVHQVSSALVLLGWQMITFHGYSILTDGFTSAFGTALVLALGLLAWHWRPAFLAWLWIVALLLPRALVLHDASALTLHHLYLPFLAVWLQSD